MNDLGKMLQHLVVLSTKFPDVEIRTTIQDGAMTIAIPKGKRGDAFAALWGNPDGLYCIPAGSAEHN